MLPSPTHAQSGHEKYPTRSAGIGWGTQIPGENQTVVATGLDGVAHHCDQPPLYTAAPGIPA